MTKRTRTVIFISFVFIFLLLAPLVILYSQGYRFDFEDKKIVQTGGLYFRVLPNRVYVYLNGKFQKNTSMISNSAFIENLLPKTYEVEIKKDGYWPWKKTLEVKEKEVTEAKSIVLFTQNPEFTTTSQAMPKITAVATSTDKNRFLEASDYEIWIFDLKKEKRVFLTRFSEKIGDIFWLNDNYLIFNVGNKIKISETDTRDGLNIIDLAEFPNPKIVWDKNSKELYVMSEGAVYKTSMAF